mgnify:CR=1 FL=1
MTLKAGFFWWNRLDFTFESRPTLEKVIVHHNLKRRS